MLDRLFGHRKPNVTCPYCGQELFGDELYCTNCGKALPNHSINAQADAISDATPENDSCPHCGAPVFADDTFCITCGKPLQRDVQPTVNPTPPKKEQPKQVPTNPTPRDSPKDEKTLVGKLVPTADVTEDDDPTARAKLVRLTRQEARNGCTKKLQIENTTYSVRIPPGATVDVQLRIEGLGYADNSNGTRGPLLVGFHVV